MSVERGSPIPVPAVPNADMRFGVLLAVIAAAAVEGAPVVSDALLPNGLSWPMMSSGVEKIGLPFSLLLSLCFVPPHFMSWPDSEFLMSLRNLVANAAAAPTASAVPSALNAVSTAPPRPRPLMPAGNRDFIRDSSPPDASVPARRPSAPPATSSVLSAANTATSFPIIAFAAHVPAPRNAPSFVARNATVTSCPHGPAFLNASTNAFAARGAALAIASATRGAADTKAFSSLSPRCILPIDCRASLISGSNVSFA